MPPSLILATGALLFFDRFTKNNFYAIIDKESYPSETVLLAIWLRVSSTRESLERGEDLWVVTERLKHLAGSR